MTRRILTRLYDLAGIMAEIYLVGICVTIVAQIVARIMGATVGSTKSVQQVFGSARPPLVRYLDSSKPILGGETP
jgi:hypothetical protein